MNTSPKASPGIRAAAIVALIGSGLSILLGVIEIAMTSIPMPAPAGPAMPPGFMKFGIFFAAAMSFGFGAWGISSAIGLLRLRNWARISTIAYSAILVSFAFLGIVAILTVPLPPPPAGQFPQGQIPSPEAFAKSIRFFMAAFYLVPIAVGVWWLIFFTRPRVKAQFFGTPLQSQQPPAFPPHPCGGVIDIDTDRLPPLPPAIASRRPISLSIIGWYMIAVGFLMLPAIPFMRFPALVLGWSLTGRPAMFFYLVSAIVVAALGYGILELKPDQPPARNRLFRLGRRQQYHHGLLARQHGPDAVRDGFNLSHRQHLSGPGRVDRAIRAIRPLVRRSFRRPLFRPDHLVPDPRKIRLRFPAPAFLIVFWTSSVPDPGSIGKDGDFVPYYLFGGFRVTSITIGSLCCE